MFPSGCGHLAHGGTGMMTEYLRGTGRQHADVKIMEAQNGLGETMLVLD